MPINQSWTLLILIMFLMTISMEEENTKSIYDFVQNALMALVGGSIAVAKDILGIDKNEPLPTPTDDSDDNADNQNKGSG